MHLRSPLERLGFDAFIVQQLLPAELKGLIERNSRALMALFHPDRNDGDARFLLLRRDIELVLGEDFDRVRKEYINSSDLGKELARKKQELAQAEAHRYSANQFRLMHDDDYGAWTIDRAWNWAVALFGNIGDFGPAPAFFNLWELAGRRVVLGKRAKRVLPRVPPSIRQRIENLEAAMEKTDVARIKSEIRRFQARIDAGEGSGGGIAGNISNLRVLLERHRLMALELAETQELARKKSMPPPEEMVLIQDDLSIEGKGMVVGYSGVARPAFLSHCHPFVRLDDRLAYVEKSGSLNTCGLLKWVEPRQAAPGFIESEETAIVRTCDHDGPPASDPFSVFNPLAVLGISSAFLAEAKPELRAEFARAYAKNLFAVAAQRKGSESLLKEVSAAINEMKKPQALAWWIAAHVSPGSKPVQVAELERMIKKVNNEARETSIMRSREHNLQKALMASKATAEAYIRMLLEGLYGESYFGEGPSRPLLLHKAHGAWLIVSEGNGSRALHIERRGARVYAAYSGGEAMVLGSTLPGMGGVGAELLGKGRLGYAFAYSLPALVEGSEILYVTGGKAVRGGVIERMDAPPDCREMAADYVTIVRRMEKADSQRKQAAPAMNLGIRRMKRSL